MVEHEGFAGASAYRESRQPHGARDRAAWRAGADGERAVGRLLDELADAGVCAVHDRRMPGTLGNIDHIAIAPSGVYVIDAKNYSGHPRVETSGAGSAVVHRLYIGRDEHTDLVRAVRRQVRAVAGELAEPSVPVRGILCFVGAEWEVLNGYLVDGVGVTSTRGVAELLRMPGPLDPARVDALQRRVLAAFDPA